MRTTLKAAIAAMALTGAAFAAAPASAQQFGLGIGPNGGISFSYDSGGYCDQWGCPDSFWNMPVYYGPVFFAGQWYDGPVYYRDWRGEREYWIHGQWRRDEWRGPRPGWYRPGRYGPPLGMDYYRSHNFHGRWDHDRGFDRGRNFGPDNRGQDFGPRGDDRGRGFGPRGDDRRDGFNGSRDNRPDQRGQDQRGQDQRGQDRGQGNFGNRGASQGPQQGPSNPPPQGFQPRGGAYGHYDRPQQQAPQQPAPAAAPAAPPPDNGNRGNGGDHQGRRGDR